MRRSFQRVAHFAGAVLLGSVALTPASRAQPITSAMDQWAVRNCATNMASQDYFQTLGQREADARIRQKSRLVPRHRGFDGLV